MPAIHRNVNVAETLHAPPPKTQSEEAQDWVILAVRAVVVGGGILFAPIYGVIGLFLTSKRVSFKALIMGGLLAAGWAWLGLDQSGRDLAAWVWDGHLQWQRHLMDSVGGEWSALFAGDTPLLKLDTWYAEVARHRFLGPLLACVVGMLVPIIDVFDPSVDTEKVEVEPEDNRVPSPQRPAKERERAMRKMPELVASTGRLSRKKVTQPVIGQLIGGDLDPSMVVGDKVTVPDEVLALHGLFNGKTGMGKSVALDHMVEAALHHGRRVVMVDLGGDTKRIPAFVAACLQAGVEPDRIGTWPIRRVDMFTPRAGLDIPRDMMPSEAVVERLVRLAAFGNKEGSDAYFLQRARAIASLAASKQPTSASEFIAACNDSIPEAVGEGYTAGNVKESMAQLRSGLNLLRRPPPSGWDPYEEVGGRLRERLLTDVDGGEGSFRIGDCSATILTVPGLGVPNAQAAKARMLLVALEQQVGAWADQGIRSMLVVDEAGVAGAAYLKDLAERVRKFDCGLWIAAQSVVSLAKQGQREEAQAVLQTVGTIATFQLADAKSVLDFTSTVEAQSRAQREFEGETTGSATVFDRRTYALDPNDLISLPMGTMAVLREGTSGYVDVRPPVQGQRLAEARDLVEEWSRADRESLVVKREVEVEETEDQDESEPEPSTWQSDSPVDEDNPWGDL